MKITGFFGKTLFFVFAVSIAAGVNAQNSDEPPLLSSTAHGQTETVLLLIERGADVNGRNYNGETALHIAANKGNVQLIKLLLSAGADVNLKDSEGKTPLDAARQSGKTEVVELLEKAEAESKEAEYEVIKSEGNKLILKRVK